MRIDGIHKAERGDLEELVGLYRSLCGLPGCKWSEDYPDRETALCDIENGDAFLLRDDAGNIAACITVTLDPDLDELDCWNEALSPFGAFMRVGVRADLQGQGVARGLVRFALEELRRRGYRGVRFLVSPENQAALACYAHFGFHAAGECTMYDLDWICMEGDLTEARV